MHRGSGQGFIFTEQGSSVKMRMRISAPVHVHLESIRSCSKFLRIKKSNNRVKRVDVEGFSNNRTRTADRT